MADVDLLDTHIEDRLLRALLAHPRLAGLTRDVLGAEHFSTRIKAQMYEAIQFYHREFGESPTHDLLLLTLRELHGEIELLQRLVARIFTLPVPDWGWMVAKLDAYIRRIRLQKAMFEVSTYLHEEKSQVAVAEERLIKAVRHVGLAAGERPNDLELARSEVASIMDDARLFCAPTRIFALDALIGGFWRKELTVVMSPLNVGKSWAMVHFIVSALLSGRFVLHFTLEMSRERVLQRILQNISGVANPHHDTALETAVQVWAENWAAKNTRQVATVHATDVVMHHLDILRRYAGKLSVREYASGSATINDLERDVLLFDTQFEHPPDLILIDGLMDMKGAGSADAVKFRLGLNDLVKEMRRLAKVHDCSVVVSHQANREAVKTGKTELWNVGESLGIMQISDTAIGLSQTKLEYEERRMRLTLLRARNQRKWGEVEIFQNLDLGQFAQYSRKLEPAAVEAKPKRRKAKPDAD